jgi:hypothetical protein
MNPGLARADQNARSMVENSSPSAAAALASSA